MTHPNAPALFLEISALLTGFSKSELSATGMLDCYFDTVLQNNTADNKTNFFKTVDSILKEPGRTPASTRKAIADKLIPSGNFGGMASNMIMLWYTGNLFNIPDDPGNSKVVNAESYKQGLMWTAGHTHPPGAKQPGFGSWANPPFSVNNNQ